MLNHVMVHSKRTALIEEIKASRKRAAATRTLTVDQRWTDSPNEVQRQRSARQGGRSRNSNCHSRAGRCPNDRPATKRGSERLSCQHSAARRTTSSTTQCGCKTAKGQHCHTHMRLHDGLRVTTSTVAQAPAKASLRRGTSLPGEHLADYTGDELIIRRDGDGGPYCLALTQRRAIDAASDQHRLRTVGERSTRGSERRPKCGVRAQPRAGHGPASRDGTQCRERRDEIFVSYGGQYWATFGPNQAKVLARPAPGQPHERVAAVREVIDLTVPWESSTFSSELAAEFDAACAADAAYTARLAKGRPGAVRRERATNVSPPMSW